MASTCALLGPCSSPGSATLALYKRLVMRYNDLQGDAICFLLRRWDEMDVKRENRALLVVANLATHGRQNYRLLYQFLDASSIVMPRVLLGARYHQMRTLTGDQATVANFVDRLAELAADPQIEAIDVLINLHGEKRRLWFFEGVITVSRLADLLAAKQIQHKLRLLYSTACYGANHATDFVRAGFDVASGAIAVNANGAHDYPVQLLNWARGKPYKAALEAGNNEPLTRISDRAAEKLGFEDVNSYKIAVGNGETSIASVAA